MRVEWFKRAPRHKHTWTKWALRDGTSTLLWGKAHAVSVRYRECTECGYPEVEEITL